MNVLSVEDLRISYRSRGEWREVVHNVSFSIQRGEMLAFVGESGSGKTTTAQAIIGLLADNARRDGGRIVLNGEVISDWSAKRLNRLRGVSISLVPQDPGNSLNPVKTIGQQVEEILRLHQSLSAAERRQQVLNLLTKVGLSHPEQRFDQYPHQLSGGMKQRVLIAIAIALQPDLIIADEPTSALDVTVQKRILDLLDILRRESGTAVLFVTHDLALVAEAAHKIIVMYAGQVVETGDAKDIFRAPRHPYTQALLRALPEFAQDKARLASLPGVVPGKYDRPVGCLLNPRCPYATDKCRSEEPALADLTGGRQSKCHYPLDDAGRPGL